MFNKTMHSMGRRIPPHFRACRGLRQVTGLTLALLVLAGLAALPASADTGSGYAVDHGIAIYYAVIPAEILRGHAKGHPEATMHGGVPGRKHTHHLMVALFDAKTLDRITDANVTATVGEVGLAEETNELEPFTVAGALTYGNYFELRPNADYLVRVDVKAPGRTSPAHVEFQFTH